MKTVVAADFAGPGGEDMLGKEVGDFAAKGIIIYAAALRAEMDLLLGFAKAQIAAG